MMESNFALNPLPIHVYLYIFLPIVQNMNMLVSNHYVTTKYIVIWCGVHTIFMWSISSIW